MKVEDARKGATKQSEPQPIYRQRMNAKSRKFQKVVGPEGEVIGYVKQDASGWAAYDKNRRRLSQERYPSWKDARDEVGEEWVLEAF